MTSKRTVMLAAAAAMATQSAQISSACQLPPVSDLSLNVSSQRGSSANTTINAAVSQILADIQQVRYDASNSYINATGIPSHPIGPWPGNPNQASNQNWLYRVPLSPQVNNGTKTATGLGSIGMMVNGVPFFNSLDAFSYQNRNIWHQNANVVEAPSFDAGKGHPQQTGVYHYHQQPALLRQQLGDDGTHHSPLLGFAFDGFPVYGPHGYANANGTGAVERVESSYRTRNITTRTTLANGTVLTTQNYGPAVSASFPLGYYVEDFEYVGGLGDLDQYNGRFAVTPEYPEGTYAYYTTLDSSGNAMYPYIVGPNYYGTVQTDNISRTVSVPASVSTLSGASSATWSATTSGEWCGDTNWAGGIAPRTIGASATLGEVVGAPAGGLSIDMDSPQRVGALTFSGGKPYNLSGVNPLVVLSYTSGAVNVNSGTHTISAPLIIGTTTSFNVAFGSSLNVTNMQPTGSAVTKTGAGTMNVTGLSCGALSVTSGTMKITGGVSKAAKVTTLSVTGGSIDVADSKLVVKSGTVSAITSLIQSGAIKTTMSDPSSVLTTLAVATASDCGYAGTNFGGVSLAGSDVLIMYTWGGDADLNGELNGDDYFYLDSHILQDSSAASFHNGDFNYDGQLNGDDYFVLDSNVLYAQASGIDYLSGSGVSGLAAVPEPTNLATLLALAVKIRRRRNS